MLRKQIPIHKITKQVGIINTLLIKQNQDQNTGNTAAGSGLRWIGKIMLTSFYRTCPTLVLIQIHIYSFSNPSPSSGQRNFQLTEVFTKGKKRLHFFKIVFESKVEMLGILDSYVL